MSFPVEAFLFVLLVATAIAVVRLADLFAAAMLTGIFSLLSAGMFLLMDAVDVAFTEAAVGAGITTVLLLGALSLTTSEEHLRPVEWLPIGIVTLTGAVLILATLDLPRYGDPEAVIHHHVVPRYIEGTRTEFGIPNIVTAVLAGYRGYDTLGETTVVFTATIGVLLLLSGFATRSGRPAESYVPRRKRSSSLAMRSERLPIVRVVAMLVLPFILLFALYVQFHGDFGPGGGFQAGVIFAAGLILYGLSYGLDRLRRVVPARWLEVGLALGVLLYAGTGVASFALGGNFLDYAVFAHDPVQGRHLGILLVEGGVGIAVACAMTLIFYGFAGRLSTRPDGTVP